MNKVLVEEKRISRLVKKTVAETFRDMLQDPDWGFELQTWVKRRLGKKPTRTITLDTLRKKYL